MLYSFVYSVYYNRWICEIKKNDMTMVLFTWANYLRLATFSSSLCYISCQLPDDFRKHQKPFAPLWHRFVCRICFCRRKTVHYCHSHLIRLADAGEERIERKKIRDEYDYYFKSPKRWPVIMNAKEKVLCKNKGIGKMWITASCFLLELIQKVTGVEILEKRNICSGFFS